MIDKNDVIPEEYTTYFRSVIAFGKIYIMEDEPKMRKAIELLAKKYHPDSSKDERNIAIDREWKPLCMMEFSIEHLSEKEAIELVNMQSAKES